METLKYTSRLREINATVSKIFNMPDKTIEATLHFSVDEWPTMRVVRYTDNVIGDEFETVEEVIPINELNLDCLPPASAPTL